MDSHKIRNGHWSQFYQLKKIRYNICGYSRAAYRSGFYIPELGIMLDAGPQSFNKPSHIFITHSHADHVAELPFTLIGDEGGDHIFNLYGPQKAESFIRKYISSLFSMNAMVNIKAVNDWYNYHPLTTDPPNNELRLNIKNNDIKIQVIECDHKIPTVSYVFRQVKKKLKDEYLGLPGKEIVELKKAGTEITKEVENHLFAYVCDCSIKTVQRYEEDLTKCPYVIIECTFILPDELENAKETQHIHWNQLQPYVAKYPNTTWVLIHFSLRYKDEDIREFFKEYLEQYKNLHVWVPPS